jgi:hypothetical protein
MCSQAFAVGHTGAPIDTTHMRLATAMPQWLSGHLHCASQEAAKASVSGSLPLVQKSSTTLFSRPRFGDSQDLQYFQWKYFANQPQSNCRAREIDEPPGF